MISRKGKRTLLSAERGLMQTCHPEFTQNKREISWHIWGKRMKEVETIVLINRAI